MLRKISSWVLIFTLTLGAAPLYTAENFDAEATQGTVQVDATLRQEISDLQDTFAGRKIRHPLDIYRVLDQDIVALRQTNTPPNFLTRGSRSLLNKLNIFGGTIRDIASARMEAFISEVRSKVSDKQSAPHKFGREKFMILVFYRLNEPIK